jgi:hypothetical protein
MKPSQPKTTFRLLVLFSLLTSLLLVAALPAGTSRPANKDADTRVRYYSVPNKDGWIKESTETSGVGGAMNSSEGVIKMGDNANNMQVLGILHFNTSALPDNAVISRAVLWVKRESSLGIDPFDTHGTLKADAVNGFFGATSLLEMADFSATGAVHGYFIKLDMADGVWYRATLNGYDVISRTGATQFRLRFSWDDNNDHIADILRVYSGEAATVGWRPVLVIDYHLP